MLTLKEKISKNFINSIGWNCKQKYLIIESDDWGSVRMPSKEVFNVLKKNNIAVDRYSFDRNDSVESEEDLNALFDTLTQFKDISGNHPIITAYSVVTNPDFEKIEHTGRKEYHYETVLETYKRTEHTRMVPKIIQRAMAETLFFPQYHGREHIHMKRYMEAINSNSDKENLAFTHRAIISAKSSTCTNGYTKDYFKGFAYSNTSEFVELEEIHRDGLKIFKEIYGFSSVSFVAQGGVWGDHILQMMAEQNVKLIGGQQQVPKLGGGYDTVNNYWGRKNKYDQIYWRRNCRFEPARNLKLDWINYCLAEIEIAFRWGKPAVISSHRENFIGSIVKENRVNSLCKLEVLLTEILKRWPDVHFISTAQLAEIMLAEKR